MKAASVQMAPGEVTSMRFLGKWEVPLSEDTTDPVINAEGVNTLRLAAAVTIDHNDEEVITVFAAGWPVWSVHRLAWEDPAGMTYGHGEWPLLDENDLQGRAQRAVFQSLGTGDHPGEDFDDLLAQVTAAAGWAPRP